MRHRIFSALLARAVKGLGNAFDYPVSTHADIGASCSFANGARPDSSPSGYGTDYIWSYTSCLALNSSTTYWIVLDSAAANGGCRPAIDCNEEGATAPFTTSSGWKVPSATTVPNFATCSSVGGAFTGEPVNAWLAYPKSAAAGLCRGFDPAAEKRRRAGGSSGLGSLMR